MTLAREVFPTRLPADCTALIFLGFARGFFATADEVPPSETSYPVKAEASSTTLSGPLPWRFFLEGFAIVNHTLT